MPSDRVKVVDARQIFDLWDDLHVTAVLCDQMADLLYVRRTLDERCRNKVHIVLNAEDNVALVLLRDRRQTQLDARRRHALARRHRAAVLDGCHDVLAADFVDHEPDKTVREEQRVARLYLAVKLLVIHADMCLVPRRIVIGQRELFALLELHLALCELAEAHLRALRIEDQ